MWAPPAPFVTAIVLMAGKDAPPAASGTETLFRLAPSRSLERARPAQPTARRDPSDGRPGVSGQCPPSVHPKAGPAPAPGRRNPPPFRAPPRAESRCAAPPRRPLRRLARSLLSAPADVLNLPKRPPPLPRGSLLAFSALACSASGDTGGPGTGGSGATSPSGGSGGMGAATPPSTRSAAAARAAESQECKNVDVLFVVDNSASMGDDQQSLINSFLASSPPSSKSSPAPRATTSASSPRTPTTRTSPAAPTSATSSPRPEASSRATPSVAPSAKAAAT